MTSEYEGFPMAMVEAMSCGLPCILPDISNIPTLAKHEYNSLLVPVGDTEKYANGIYNLLNDVELYEKLAENSVKIREQKKHEYSLENSIQLWTQVLNKIFT